MRHGAMPVARGELEAGRIPWASEDWLNGNELRERLAEREAAAGRMRTVANRNHPVRFVLE